MTDLFLGLIATAVSENITLTAWLIIHLDDKEEDE